MKNNFTKEDLQTGHIVVTRGEGNAILLGNSFKRSSYLMNELCMSELIDYNYDLKTKSGTIEHYTIDKVYKIVKGTYSLETLIDELPKDGVELLWERKKEIDWSKVPKFTRVQVRDEDEEEWLNRYFIGYMGDILAPYLATFYGEFTHNGSYTCWKQIRIYDESEIKEGWYK